MENQEKKDELLERQVVKVISGTGKKVQKSGLQKIKGSFLSEDMSKVKSFVLTDVILPTLKKGLSDVITKGLDMILYGGDGGGARGGGASSSYGYNQVPYRDYSRDYSQSYGRDYNKPVTSLQPIFDGVELLSRVDANKLLRQMDVHIRKYGSISAHELYTMVGIPAAYPDYSYGWGTIVGASISPCPGGFRVNLPRPIQLSK